MAYYNPYVTGVVFHPLYTPKQAFRKWPPTIYGMPVSGSPKAPHSLAAPWGWRGSLCPAAPAQIGGCAQLVLGISGVMKWHPSNPNRFWLVVSTSLKHIRQIWESSPNRSDNKKYLKPYIILSGYTVLKYRLSNWSRDKKLLSGVMKCDTNPNQCTTIFGKSLKNSIHLHCLISPPKNGSRLMTPVKKGEQKQTKNHG